MRPSHTNHSGQGVGFTDLLAFDPPAGRSQVLEVESASLRPNGLRMRKVLPLKKFQLLQPNTEGMMLCGCKTAYVHYDHVDFIIDDHSWLSRCKNFRKRRVRHPAPLPPQLSCRASCLGSEPRAHTGLSGPLSGCNSEPIQRPLSRAHYMPGAV